MIPDPELRLILVYSQQQLDLRVTSFELAVTCPVDLSDCPYQAHDVGSSVHSAVFYGSYKERPCFGRVGTG